VMALDVESIEFDLCSVEVLVGESVLLFEPCEIRSCGWMNSGIGLDVSGSGASGMCVKAGFISTSFRSRFWQY
jgi:hypothetical protein